MRDNQSSVFNLAVDTELAPQVRTHALDGVMVPMMNADAVIALAKKTDTPEARRVYRAYRKLKAELKRDDPDLKDALLRQRAIMGVLPVTLVSQ